MSHCHASTSVPPWALEMAAAHLQAALALLGGSTGPPLSLVPSPDGACPPGLLADARGTHGPQRPTRSVFPGAPTPSPIRSPRHARVLADRTPTRVQGSTPSAILPCRCSPLLGMRRGFASGAFLEAACPDTLPPDCSPAGETACPACSFLLRGCSLVGSFGSNRGAAWARHLPTLHSAPRNLHHAASSVWVPVLALFVA